MTIYEISYARGVKKDFRKIHKKQHGRIVAAIRKLAVNPRPEDARKLVGLPSFRIRVGDYRVIYNIDDEIVTVLVVKVAHRREVYR